MSVHNMPAGMARDEAFRHGNAIDLIDAVMIERGCSSALLIETHLCAALAYSSIGRPNASGFRRIREVLDELEQLLVGSAESEVILSE